jgi:amidase
MHACLLPSGLTDGADGDAPSAFPKSGYARYAALRRNQGAEMIDEKGRSPGSYAVDRRRFLKGGITAGVAAIASGVLGRSAHTAQVPSSNGLQQQDLDEITIEGLQRTMADGSTTSRSIIEAYLERIEANDRRGPALGSFIELNPKALDVASALDSERREKGARGPLHGIPILLKDNIDTSDMPTTAGSLALEGWIPPRDSFVAARLREAGAVIIGKANLSEWANFRSTKSTSGWSAVGGQCRNPYALDRNPCGSSSGSGVAVAPGRKGSTR